MDQSRLQLVDDVIEEAIADRTIPGAVLIAVRSGVVVHYRAYGQRAVVPSSERMTLDTIFDMASLSKPLSTAASVMKLVEAGKIRLQDRVSVYMPEFEGNGKGAIRVAQLLTHTSGLAPYAPVDSIASMHGRPTVEGVWKWIVDHPPRFDPGERFLYSDLNYVTLAHLVNRTSGMPLNEYAEQMIYEPLGMVDTSFFPPASAHSRIAPTEQLEDRVLRGEVHDPLARLQGGVGGSAGLFSTAWDVALFAQMLLNGGVYNDIRIFSPLAIRAMTTIQDTGRGYGFDVASPYSNLRGDLLGSDSFGHTGYTGTSLWIDREQQLIIALMTNRVHPTDTTSVVALRSKVSNAVAAAVVSPPPGPH
jgi:CubicO group peptidase (beta-lactamase class C family)